MKLLKIQQLVLVTLLLSIFASPVWAAVSEVTASVDKNPVMLDESFTLIVTADGDVDRNAFDSSPLLKDFVVGRTSVSSQTRMVNFETSRSTTWSTTLFPRNTGSFVIPSFEIEGVATTPFAIDVIPVSTGNQQESRDIFVKAELAQDQVYLHQQVKYTVKLYLAKDIERGSLQSPELEHAEIQQIGQDAEYSEIINGKRYRIIQRHFVVTPQKSGTFTINGPVFQGEIIANSRQSFGFFNRTQTVSRVGPTLTLNVLPIPDSVSADFLPSEFVDLQEEWSNGNGNWRVGEPVTRTITLTAVGVTESLMPEISDQYPPDIKTYPDQPSTATAEKDQTLIAQRTESTALIPARAGEFVIPPVTVEWFNVVTEEVEQATIPGRSITVQPAADQPQSNQTPVAPSSTAKVDSQTTVTQNTPPMESVQRQIAVSADTEKTWHSINNPYVWATLVSIALWVLSFSILRHRYRHRQFSKSVSSIAEQQTEKQLWQALQRALKTRNIADIEAALHAWLQNFSHHSTTSLAQCLDELGDPALRHQISILYASRYASEQRTWQHAELSTALQTLRSKLLKKEVNKNQELVALYP